MAKAPINVLLIDDDESDYFLTRDLLQEIDANGFVVDWKSNYETGLKAICEGKFDICLLDLRLGSRTGLDLLREAKANHCIMPVIVLTGESAPDIDYSAMELGAADFLEKKDLTSAKLDRAIRYTLLQHRHAEELERRVQLRTEDLASTNLALQTEIKAREYTEAALRESEGRFRHLADSMPQIVWISKPDGSLEYINTQWIVYTGLTLEESRTIEQCKVVFHSDDWQPFLDSWTKAIECQTIHEIELRIKHIVEGEYRWFLTRSVPVFNGEGKLIKWYGTSTDIHDQKMQEQAQREASHRKDEFLASMAHELRNPLPPIRNALEIMRLSNYNPQVVEKSRAMIERQLQQLIRLIDDLLDLSRITRGKIRLRVEPIDLQAVVEAAVETSRPHIDAAQHQLTVILPPVPVHFEGDFTRLTQVIVNLLNNASKFTNPKGEIILSASVEEDNLLIKVLDNGIGIPAEMIGHIFDLFSQVQRPDSHAQIGLGIGLALVRSIVQLHQGTVEANSPGTGKGTEFIIRLPLAHPVTTAP